MTTTTATAAREMLTDGAIRERVARLPRIPFAFTPTPLEACPNITATLGGDVRVLIKRDDLTGFAFGGNKVRALEFRMADVRAKGCDAFVLVNIGQSNHARLHASACTRLGIRMAIVKPSPADEEVTGNLLLDRVVGVEIVEAHGRESEAVLGETLARLRAEGFKPYASTREPFSRLAGTVAYLEASIELRDQLRAAGIGPDQQVHLPARLRHPHGRPGVLGRPVLQVDVDGGRGEQLQTQPLEGPPHGRLEPLPGELGLVLGQPAEERHVGLGARAE